MRIDDIFELVKQYPCTTATELMYLFDANIDSKSRNDRIIARNKISKRLWRLYRQGYVEPIPDSRPVKWRLFGSGEIVRNYKSSGKSMRARCRENGIAESTVRYRIKRGWSVEDALTIPPKGKVIT